MTPKQILDSFSETLIQDERILSAQERTLVATLLQHAKTATADNPQTQEAVRAVIASAVGETVAQRAFSVLGSSIVERILDGGALSIGDSTERAGEISAGKRKNLEPQPPSKPGEPQPPSGKPMGEPQPPSGRPMGEPQPPSTGPGVRAPQKEPHRHDTPAGPGPKEPQPPSGRPMGEPQPPSTGPGVRAPQKEPHRRDTPAGPGPKEPQPPSGRPMAEPQPPSAGPGPHGVRTTVVSGTMSATADRPEVLPARCVLLDEFLAPQELEELTLFTLEHEADFSTSEVVSPNADGGIVNYEHRRSRVLMDLGHHQELILARIKAVLPQVLQTLGMEEFSIAEIEAQVTASNEGDFFHFHSDSGSDPVASRYLTFVYFFHREPRQFEGGELRIHDARLEEGTYVSEGSYQTIVPQQNQIVFFPCQLMHEITPVICASQNFADSRFTLNGWLRR